MSTLDIVLGAVEAVASVVTLAMGWIAAMRGFRRYFIVFMVWAALFLFVPDTGWLPVALSWGFGAASASFLHSMRRARDEPT